MFAPGVLAFSRILNNQEVLVIANASTQDNFTGYVLIDAFLNGDGDQYRVFEPAERRRAKSSSTVSYIFIIIN
jgi:hypothetical protein